MIPFLPLLWKYRKLAGYALAAMALAALLWRVSVWRSGWQELKAAQVALEAAKSELDAYREGAEQAKRDVEAKDAAYQRISAERDIYADQVSGLLQRPPIDPKTLIVRVPTNAPDVTCPDRGPEYRLRYNAIADGSGS